MEFLQTKFLGNDILAWGIAVGIVLVVLTVTRVLKAVLVRRFASRAAKTTTELDDFLVEMVRKIRLFVLFALALYSGSLALELPERFTAWIRALTFIFFLVQLGIWGNALISFFLERYRQRHLEQDPDRVTSLRAVSFVARLTLYSIVILLALDNLPGVEITTLIAGLGIGGIAIALAVQNVLGDLFASLSIALDKPFVIGDFIIVGEFLGTVEYIGLKTTRIRSLSGEQLVFSNNDLLKSRIRNYKRMKERRILFSFGVVYQTPSEKLEKIPGFVREIVEAQEKARFDRAHFKEYGDFSLNFEVVYYVLVPDYPVYMDTQQAINLALYRKFEEEEIEFAYPTQTLYLNRSNPETDQPPSP
jgi:small-conductance mechanosensitive channel